MKGGQRERERERERERMSERYAALLLAGKQKGS